MGIYKIQSKIKPERVYIGSSSINIKLRWRDHLRRMREGTHHSRKLQNHYNKYGEDDFVFSIVAICDADELTPINGIVRPEQFFIWAYDPWFNSIPFAGSPKGLKPSNETRLKMSLNHADIRGEKNPMFGKKHSEDTRKLMSLKWKGRKPSPESIQKRIQTLKEHPRVVTYEQRLLFSGRNNPRSRMVLNMCTGIYYDTAKDAHRSLGCKINRDHFTAMLRGSAKNLTSFMYITQEKRLEEKKNAGSTT